jgi:hypothetical protein
MGSIAEAAFGAPVAVLGGGFGMRLGSALRDAGGAVFRGLASVIVLHLGACGHGVDRALFLRRQSSHKTAGDERFVGEIDAR